MKLLLPSTISIFDATQTLFGIFLFALLSLDERSGSRIEYFLHSTSRHFGQAYSISIGNHRSLDTTAFFY